MSIIENQQPFEYLCLDWFISEEFYLLMRPSIEFYHICELEPFKEWICSEDINSLRKVSKKMETIFIKELIRRLQKCEVKYSDRILTRTLTKFIDTKINILCNIENIDLDKFSKDTKYGAHEHLLDINNYIKWKNIFNSSVIMKITTQTALEYTYDELLCILNFLKYDNKYYHSHNRILFKDCYYDNIFSIYYMYSSYICKLLMLKNKNFIQDQLLEEKAEIQDSIARFLIFLDIRDPKIMNIIFQKFIIHIRNTNWEIFNFNFISKMIIHIYKYDPFMMGPILQSIEVHRLFHKVKIFHTHYGGPFYHLLSNKYVFNIGDSGHYNNFKELLDKEDDRGKETNSNYILKVLQCVLISTRENIHCQYIRSIFKWIILSDNIKLLNKGEIFNPYIEIILKNSIISTAINNKEKEISKMIYEIINNIKKTNIILKFNLLINFLKMKHLELNLSNNAIKIICHKIIRDYENGDKDNNNIRLFQNKINFIKLFKNDSFNNYLVSILEKANFKKLIDMGLILF